jgi:hypothetical protein
MPVSCAHLSCIQQFSVLLNVTCIQQQDKIRYSKTSTFITIPELMERNRKNPEQELALLSFVQRVDVY